MYLRDRLANLAGLAFALGLWALVAVFLTTNSPSGEPGIQASGALLLGVAVGVTALPLFWLAAFARRRIAYRGDWLRAIRRASLAGIVTSILFLLQILGALSLPIALFVAALAVFVEVILTSRQ